MKKIIVLVLLVMTVVVWRTWFYEATPATAISTPKVTDLAPQTPFDPLAQMELRNTKKCTNHFHSGRYGCARECSTCTNQDDCKKWHGGTDLRALEKTPFKIIFGGKKIVETYSNTWGLYVMVESDNVKDNNGLAYEKVTLVYCHLDPSETFPANIPQGYNKGFTGKTGNASNEETHMHIEAYNGKFRADKSNAIDPELFFKTRFVDLYGINPNNAKCKKPSDNDCCGTVPK